MPFCMQISGKEGETLRQEEVRILVLSYSSGIISAKLEHSRKPLVSGISFELDKGESLALIGETGSGKTMTALSVMGLLPQNVRMEDGRVALFGEQIFGRKLSELLGNKIVYIPQNGLEFLNPSRRIRDQLFDSLKRLGVPRGRLRETAAEKLSLAGFPCPEEILGRYPFQLSGGMAQRVTIALAACSRAEIIIADEPTNGLDEEARQRFMELIEKAFPEAAKLLITHDISLAALCGKALVLCGGRMMERGPSRAVLKAPHSGYTQALIAAGVSSGMKETPVLRGESGLCPFYRRCGKASSRCLREMDHGTDGVSEWWCCHAEN